MHELDRRKLNAGRTLPHAYGVDRLVLLPRDPHCLFAYWEVTPNLEQRMVEQFGPDWATGQTVLRLVDLDYGRSTDTSLHPGTDHWYLNAEGEDRHYRAELGRILPDGRFIAMVSSNTVRTPRGTISPVIDPRWKMFAFWQHRYYRRMPGGLSSFELFSPETARNPEGGLM